ncbi:hypothetical protein [Roseibium sediminis]|uniref:hypothetical protein n=1 Tax=Roseibium sediminis TaxID=1775174 RepID=UPI00123CEEF2|nr:hypothetical protein [Roseibium sediminis]
MRSTDVEKAATFRTGTMLRIASAALIIALMTAALDLSVPQRILLAALCTFFAGMLFYTFGLARQLSDDLGKLASPYARNTSAPANARA